MDSAKMANNQKRELMKKYSQHYNIVNLEPTTIQDANTEIDKFGRQKIIPKSQVDYNILTNELFPDSYNIPSRKVSYFNNER